LIKAHQHTPQSDTIYTITDNRNGAHSW